MSVLMTLRVKADASKLEQMVADNPDAMSVISERGKEYGVTYHRFYATDDEVIVVDVWPDAESFQRFYEASPEIGDVMQQAGVTTEPEIRFWRELDLNDAVR
jgi:heme-degrading monooxygenase HmoA